MKAWVGGLLSLVAMTCSITLAFLSMRAMMEVGGSCGSGGPYEIATPCPGGSWLIVPGLLGALIFGGLTATCLGAVSASYTGIGALAWPGLFGSMAWNFLEYGLDPPGEMALAWGWLVCGVLFVAMAFGAFAAAPASGVRSIFWPPDEPSPGFTRPALRSLVPVPTMRPMAAPRSSAGRRAKGESPGELADVVARLERLAQLHRNGDLDAAEYEAAKQAVLR